MTSADSLVLPPTETGPGRPRLLAGAALLAVGLPTLTWALVHERSRLSYATPVLLILTLVVAVGLVGGLRVGLPAAVLGGLSLNWFFTPPYGTLAVDRQDQVVVLGVYLAVAVTVSAIVDLAARRSREAARARAEAQALAALAGATLAEQQTLTDLLERVRQVFRMREVTLLEQTGGGWTATATVTGADDAPADEAELRVPAGPQLMLVARGPRLFAEDRRVLTRFAEAAATALEGRRLAERADAATELEATDRMRTALLAAVGHDLRTPLAGIKAAVTGLRQDDVTLTDAERGELLATVELSADRLQSLVENLLDASRLQAGALSVQLLPTGLDEVVGRVLIALPAPDRQRLFVEVPEGLPDALADPGLLERALANVVDNALRHSPAGTMVTVRGCVAGEALRCDVVDHGPGVPRRDWDRVFAPFQRLDDRSPTGMGLGLVVVRGFLEAMGGAVEPAATPGGGLTMRLTLRLAAG